MAGLVDPMEELNYSVDNVEVNDTSVTVAGWALVLGEEIWERDCNVVLEGEVSGDRIVIPTMIRERPDLSLFFADGQDYTKAGYMAQVRSDKLNLKHEDYLIYLEYRSNGHNWLKKTGGMVKRIRETEWQEADNPMFRFSVDEVSTEDRKVKVEGWMLWEGRDSNEAEVTLLFRNGTTGKVYEIPTSVDKREDLNDVFVDGCDYQNAGFTSTIEIWRFDWEYEWHEVCLRYRIGDEVYDVGTGEIVRRRVN